MHCLWCSSLCTVFFLICTQVFIVQLWFLQMEPIDGKSDLEFGEDIPLNSSKPTRKATLSLDFDTSSPLQREVPNSRFAKKLRCTPFKSIYYVIIQAKINVLLPFGPLAILLHYLTHKYVSKPFLFTIFVTF